MKNSTLSYLLSRIRALPAGAQARWRENNRTPRRREAKKIVIAQWLAEVPAGPS